MGKATIHVHLKPGVFDPEGPKIKQALHMLGYTDIGAIRVGKLYEIKTDKPTPENVAAICNALLVNPVIEDYRILELEE